MVLHVGGGDLLELGGDALGGLDVLRERDRAPHGLRVQPEGVLGVSALGEPVPAAHEPGRIVEVQLAVLGERPLHRLVHRLLVHGEDQDLVVREHAEAYGLAEAEAVELRPVDVFVVHRCEDSLGLAGLRLGGVVVDPRRRGHVQTLGSLEVVLVVHAHKGGLL